jgi:aspartate racemase
MRSGLYDGPLRRRGIEPVAPRADDQEAIHRIISDELFGGRVVAESTARMVGIVRGLKGSGCEAVALACTELPLALRTENCGLPAIDTTRFLAELALARCGASESCPA